LSFDLVESLLIVGLGNPTQKYEKTRHNAGFWFLDELAKRESLSFESIARFQGVLATTVLADQKVYFLKPMTFMNNSGRSISAVSRYYKIPLEKILIAHDDLDFEAGMVRLKRNGGHGGHNGVRDAITSLGGADFLRLRIGVGRPVSREEVLSFVLKRPTAFEREAIVAGLQFVADQFELLISGKINQAMNVLHGQR